MEVVAEGVRRSDVAGQGDILDVARRQVLGDGQGLTAEQVLAVLTLPDHRLAELLELAHEVRLAWCGPEVEVEGIVGVKTGGCPEDCHFCSQSATLRLTGPRASGSTYHELVRAARETAETGATEFCIVAAVRGPDERLMRAGPRGHRGRSARTATGSTSPCSLGMLDQAQADELRRDGRAPLQPQPRDGPVVLPARS